MPQVTLWTLFFDDCRDQSALLTAYRALLSPGEIARMERFVFEKDRLRHLVSRALVRVVLGRALGIAPQALVFGEGPQGKPMLLGADGLAVRGVSFNLAHTSDVAVLAVSDTGVDIGVDVESTTRSAPLEVGLRQFSPIEAQQLQALAGPDDVEETPSAAQSEHFWHLWTLKESLIKATGLGLSTPLKRFGFERPPASQTIQLHCQPGTAEAKQAWWFGAWRPSALHMGALCVARPSATSPPPIVQARRIVPLRDGHGDSGADHTPMPLDFILHTPAS